MCSSDQSGAASEILLPVSYEASKSLDFRGGSYGAGTILWRFFGKRGDPPEEQHLSLQPANL